MRFNPGLHNRRSIRLRPYRYSRRGAYFITICTKHNRTLFGEIHDGTMFLNAFGKVAHNTWFSLAERWPHLDFGSFQVMPNHIHGILIILKLQGVSSALKSTQEENGMEENNLSTEEKRETQKQWAQNPIVGEIIGAYKSTVAVECLKLWQSEHPDELLGAVWHRNYHEHIIRTKESYETISRYIENNPKSWRDDRFFLE